MLLNWSHPGRDRSVAEPKDPRTFAVAQKFAAFTSLRMEGNIKFTYRLGIGLVPPVKVACD
jgi:hypothetical protein